MRLLHDARSRYQVQAGAPLSLSHRRLGQSRAVDDGRTVRSPNDTVDPRKAGYLLKTLNE